MKPTKHEWRKAEKQLYIPKTKPEILDIPTLKFAVISGQGNPNSPFFGEYIGALYAVSYAIKMTLIKLDDQPEGYQDYTVYPLEGVWDITEEAKKIKSDVLNKDDLVFDLMIRQPDFVSDEFFDDMLTFAKSKNDNPLLDQVMFTCITEGKSVQMMHIGSYDDEPESFQQMEKFADDNNLIRKSKIHREIYLSDFRKVAPEKLKTVLRFGVE